MVTCGRFSNLQSQNFIKIYIYLLFMNLYVCPEFHSAPKATRSNLGEPKFIQISWGSTPNPLPPHKSCVLYIIECFPSLNKKSCIKPWHVHVYTVCIVTCVTEERMRELQECSHYVVISSKDPDTHKQCHWYAFLSPSILNQSRNSYKKKTNKPSNVLLNIHPSPNMYNYYNYGT